MISLLPPNTEPRYAWSYEFVNAQWMQFDSFQVRRHTDQQHSVFQQVLTGTFKQYMSLS